jgi:hypothetical protein
MKICNDECSATTTKTDTKKTATITKSLSEGECGTSSIIEISSEDCTNKRRKIIEPSCGERWVTKCRCKRVVSTQKHLDEHEKKCENWPKKNKIKPVASKVSPLPKDRFNKVSNLLDENHGLKDQILQLEIENRKLREEHRKLKS